MKIDFVSDVSCPWCVIGLKALEQALEKIPELAVELEFQPFELNPQMAAEGEDIGEHLARKYGASAQQSSAARENIRQRGAQLGFSFDMNARGRIYNTFDAHRLLHWAHLQNPDLQRALKMALFSAYFTDGQDPSDQDLLLKVAGDVGLDVAAAREVLASGAYTAEVREVEQRYRGLGIDSVPSIIINNKHLIQGGQPVEVFEQALRRIAGEAAQA